MTRSRMPATHVVTFGSALAGAIALTVALAPAAGAATVVIDHLVSPGQAVAGNGWAVHPDQAGGTEEFVDGPSTPPAGTGSLQFSVPDGTSRALIFTVANPGTGATAPGDIGPITPVPWSDLSGSSYSTYTSATTNVASSLVTVRFVGYQDYNTNNPLLSTGFTTLAFEPVYQAATVQANQWQQWTIDDTSVVWQTNATGNFCVQAVRCTLADFFAQYPNGAWGQIQLGIGALGSGTDVSSFVDAVSIVEGNTSYGYNFEVAATASSPPASPSVSPTFVPGPGDTGDADLPRAFPWTAILAGVGLVAVGSIASLRGRRRGKHS